MGMEMVESCIFHGKYGGMGTDVAGIPRGLNSFVQELCGIAVEIGEFSCEMFCVNCTTTPIIGSMSGTIQVTGWPLTWKTWNSRGI